MRFMPTPGVLPLRRSTFCGRLLLQVSYSVLSERWLVEQIDYNLLFRWFVGLGMDGAMWDHAVFSKNRDRPLTSDVAQQFFSEVNRQADQAVHERPAHHGGRHVDSGLGLADEFSIERRVLDGW